MHSLIRQTTHPQIGMLVHFLSVQRRYTKFNDLDIQNIAWKPLTSGRSKGYILCYTATSKLNLLIIDFVAAGIFFRLSAVR